MILSEFISTDMNVARSINIERDMGTPVILRHYHLTCKGLEILSRFDAALAGEKVNAWSLTGPYGMGKSSFANFLLSLCGPKDEEETRIAWNMLKQKDYRLATQLQNHLGKHGAETKGLFRIAVTSSFEPLNSTFAKGLYRAFLDLKKRSTLPSNIGKLFKKTEALNKQEKPVPTPLLAELVQEIREVYQTPIVIVIDEFGKNLEFLARFPAQGDLFLLQMLAESDGIFLWVCLHQAFEEYTARLSEKQMQEWGKIQGRFEDISFIEPKNEMIRFISETLVRENEDSALNNLVRKWAKAYFDKIRDQNLPDLKALDIDIIERFYPLHPLTAVLLPELCVRFAQNDRTLFAFLCSGDPAALPAFLAKENIDLTSREIPVFGPERLYDYFLSSTGISLLSKPGSQRWIEIQDIIERSRNLDRLHLAVLKVIGLLNLLSGPSGFRASPQLLSFAFFQPFQNIDQIRRDIENILQENEEKGVLVYREYADEYRLWEGTDFDIKKAIRERRAILAEQNLENTLKETLPLTPLIASRHSYKTGTLRYFERRWYSAKRTTDQPTLTCAHDADGLLLYCFGKVNKLPTLPSKTSDGRPIIVCYVPCEDEIKDVVLESAAAKAVLKESPELEHDGVARKEARFRAQVAEESLRSHLESIFAPGNKDAQWIKMGKYIEGGVSSQKALSRLLSDCCDEVYCDCPRIRNELINRNVLSSAAARARRVLMEAMILNEGEEMLGFKGTGPEVAIYRTMLLQENLHQKDRDGKWRFVPPTEENGYYKAWQSLSAILEEAGESQVPVTKIIDMFRRPPFGMKEGPIPVFLCLFLLVNSDEVALYQEGGYIPSIGPEDMELMSKRPEYFSIKRLRFEGLKSEVIRLYASLIQAQPSEHSMRLRNITLLSIVGPLVQFIRNLTPYARQTRNISQRAQNVRRVLQLARDPADLLYTDLPKALEIQPFREDSNVSDKQLNLFQDRFEAAITELREAYPKLLGTIKQMILEAFEYDGEIEQLRNSLRNRAVKLQQRCGDEDLGPFIKVLSAFSRSTQEWIVSLATIVRKRPVDSWRDSDLTIFATNMRDMARRFVSFEALLARIEDELPETENGRQPRMIMVTRPDGSIASRVVWHTDRFESTAREVVDRLISDFGQNRAELETIFTILSERLLVDSPKTKEDS